MTVNVLGHNATSASALHSFAEQSLAFAFGQQQIEGAEVSVQLNVLQPSQIACTLILRGERAGEVEVTAVDEDEYRAIERAADLAGDRVRQMRVRADEFDRQSIPFGD